MTGPISKGSALSLRFGEYVPYFFPQGFLGFSYRAAARQSLAIYIYTIDGAFSSASPSVQCSSRPYPCPPAQSLNREAKYYLGMALSHNTKKAYSSGVRQFYAFCSQTRVSPKLPLDEDTLINFSVCMARSVQHSTIKTYLSAVKHHHSSNGLDLNLSKFFRLQLVLRGIKRSQGVHTRVRGPITLGLLNLFYQLLNVKYTDNRDSLMIWAAMTLAFFGFLRIGELTCNSNFDPKCHLIFSDVTFMPSSSPKYMLVRLKVSKTDPFRTGQSIVIGRTNSNLCPISAMLAYLNSRTPFANTGPLFTYESGSFLTRENLTKETRLLLSKGGLDSKEYAGHSFRIGAATTAASANLPPWLIKVLGRWSSDCFERYIKTPPSVLAQVSQTLVDSL